MASSGRGGDRVTGLRDPPSGSGQLRPTALVGPTPSSPGKASGIRALQLSNAEIANTLVVGDATVKTHITRIFAKLRLHDRAQAVVLAYESGLVQPGAGQT